MNLTQIRNYLWDAEAAGFRATKIEVSRTLFSEILGHCRYGDKFWNGSDFLLFNVPLTCNASVGNFIAHLVPAPKPATPYFWLGAAA